MLKRSSILDMFARSPMRPLQEHMSCAYACAEQLPNFFDSVLQQDWQNAARVQAQIASFEHQADALKQDLRMNLPKGLLLPVSRGDILKLLSSQETLANLIKDIAGLILGRKMQIPASLAAPLQAFLMRNVQAAQQAKFVIEELSRLMESGFSGKEAKALHQVIIKLNEIETETDVMQVKLRADLFEMESTLLPVNVMFLYKIIENIGLIANCCEQIGYALQALLAD